MFITDTNKEVMAKLYSKHPSQEKSIRETPKKETIAFLLRYSKALKVTEFGKMKFETLLN